MRSTTEIVVPSLRVISQATAQREGYREITTPVHQLKESAIFDSIQRGLEGACAAWVEHPGGKFAAARKASDLLDVGKEDDRE